MNGTPPPPSSFDDNADFFEESRVQKIKRRLIEEPLIPLGCALTVWALLEATKSIRSGDKVKTNRMFRRRIYAQGFTLLAMVGGSAYWESDRKKRAQYDQVLDDKKRFEKRDAWIRELEARDEEEQAERRMREARRSDRRAVSAAVSPPSDGPGTSSIIRSILEDRDKRGQGGILPLLRSDWIRK